MGCTIPPCSKTRVSLLTSKRCSRRTCGCHVHRFPEYENAGCASDATEVGDSGEKKGTSCPAVNVVFGQLIRTTPVRSLYNPSGLSYRLATGAPPKSN